MNILVEHLASLGACQESKNWAKSLTFAENSTLQEVLAYAWSICPRGDWMLWYFSKTNPDIRKLTLVKGYCANTVRHLMRDQRSIDAVDAAITVGKGKITAKKLREAAAAAYAAARASASAADAYAAYAADAAAYNTARANTAPYAASDAASKARENNQRLTADICRKYIALEFIG